MIADRENNPARLTAQKLVNIENSLAEQRQFDGFITPKRTTAIQLHNYTYKGANFNTRHSSVQPNQNTNFDREPRGSILSNYSDKMQQLNL